MPTRTNAADVPATRRARQRAQTTDEIKALARRQLADGGTGALSLRGIAREMGMAPAALFRYFETQAALITALCVDANGALAQAMSDGQKAAPSLIRPPDCGRPSSPPGAGLLLIPAISHCSAEPPYRVMLLSQLKPVLPQ